MSHIWTPPAHRFAGLREAQKAVQDYDPNLDFGFNEMTQQWCVYLKVGTMPGSADGDLPILGFNHIPGRDEVQKKLYNSDALRHGQEILDRINRHNDKLIAESDARARDVDAGVAESLEWAFRKLDSEKAPTRKIFVPGKD